MATKKKVPASAKALERKKKSVAKSKKSIAQTCMDSSLKKELVQYEDSTEITDFGKMDYDQMKERAMEKVDAEKDKLERVFADKKISDKAQFDPTSFTYENTTWNTQVVVFALSGAPINKYDVLGLDFVHAKPDEIIRVQSESVLIGREVSGYQIRYIADKSGEQELLPIYVISRFGYKKMDPSNGFSAYQFQNHMIDEPNLRLPSMGTFFVMEILPKAKVKLTAKTYDKA